MALTKNFSDEFQLPPDFISFINSNYEKISIIRQKIQDFYEKSRQGGEVPRNRKSVTAMSSEDTDGLITPIITASFKAKRHLLKKLDTVEIGGQYLEQIRNQGSLTPTKDQLDFVRKFPMLVFSPSLIQSQEEDKLDLSLLYVDGIGIKLANRVKQTSVYSRNTVQSKRKLKSCRKTSKKRNTHLANNSYIDHFSVMIPSLNEIAWDIYTRYITNQNLTDVPQMTLPPLHASVLTLLSQGSLSAQGHGEGNEEGSAKQKKLRRQGRRRKSDSHDNDEKEDKNLRSVDQKTIDHGVNEGETTANRPLATDIPGGGRTDKEDTVAPVLAQNSSLCQVLDDRLSKTRWYLTETHLEQEIEELEKLFGKTEKRLQDLNLRDDLSLLIQSKPKKRLTLS